MHVVCREHLVFLVFILSPISFATLCFSIFFPTSIKGFVLAERCHFQSLGHQAVRIMFTAKRTAMVKVGILVLLLWWCRRVLLGVLWDNATLHFSASISNDIYEFFLNILCFSCATVFQDVCIKQCFIRFHVMKRVENINIILVSFVVLSNALAILLYSSFISIAMHYYQIAVILPLKFKQFFFLDFLIKLYTETFMIWEKKLFLDCTFDIFVYRNRVFKFKNC